MVKSPYLKVIIYTTKCITIVYIQDFSSFLDCFLTQVYNFCIRKFVPLNHKDDLTFAFKILNLINSNGWI